MDKKSSENFLNLKVSPLPNSDFVFTNAFFINPKDFEEMKTKSGAKCSLYVYVKSSKNVMQLKDSDKVAPGTIAVGKIYRELFGIGATGNLSVQYAQDSLKDCKLGKVTFEIMMTRKPSLMSLDGTFSLEEKEIEDQIRRSYSSTPINKNHVLYLEISGAVIIARAIDLEVLEEFKHLQLGYFTNETEFDLTCVSKELKIISQKFKVKKLTKDDFNFEDMGVGGLKKQFADIFRIAFASRRYPASYIEKYGIKHVRGMLLYGPPGTGKTLIARTLSKALNAEECKVVNGPELFDKYVGETEKKIRELFQKAEEDQANNGDDAGLHVIVFDEIDSICRARGTINSGTGVHDGAVNQLLTKIDGVESLNNILVIGMTNRKDLIDEAILRPGRLELHVEIGLPDEGGRLEILQIHTKKMKMNDLLDSDVNLEELSKMAKNYTGADLENLVKLSSTYALNQGINLKTGEVDVKTFRKISMRDFEMAYKEIKPMFGTDTSQLQNNLQFDIIDYGSSYLNLNSKLISLLEQVKNSKSASSMSILLEGPTGSGKTALACNLALRSEFPYVKIISPELLVGYMEAGKVGAITKIFEDAYKSPFSIILLDNLERIVEYIKIGPRFSNLILQTLLVYIKKLPPNKDRKIMIIGTTSIADRLEDLELVSAFNVRINVPTLQNAEEILNVLQNYPGKISEKEKVAALVNNIPIKQLLLMVDMTLQLSGGEITYTHFMTAYEYFVSNLKYF